VQHELAQPKTCANYCEYCEDEETCEAGAEWTCAVYKDKCQDVDTVCAASCKACPMTPCQMMQENAEGCTYDEALETPSCRKTGVFERWMQLNGYCSAADNSAACTRGAEYKALCKWNNEGQAIATHVHLVHREGYNRDKQNPIYQSLRAAIRPPLTNAGCGWSRAAKGGPPRTRHVHAGGAAQHARP
jgi:hypothetical protein